MRLDYNSYGSILLELTWNSKEAKHIERMFVKKLNLWRDIFPEQIYNQLFGSKEGDVLNFSFAEGHLLDEYRQDWIVPLEFWQFNKRFGFKIIGREILPRKGRFYPQGILNGLAGVFPQNMNPCRVVGINEKNIYVDFNHPLSGFPIDLKITVTDVRRKTGELGGSMNDWINDICSGPGMQARWKGERTDFLADDPFSRILEDEDIEFYKNPRLVSHLDIKALEP